MNKIPETLKELKKKYGLKCVICGCKVSKKNPLVRYHIAYKPQLVILACKFCNFAEFCLRRGILRGGIMTSWRVSRVIAYQKKFGVVI